MIRGLKIEGETRGAFCTTKKQMSVLVLVLLCLENVISGDLDLDFMILYFL